MFFVAAFAVERETKARRAARLGQHPLTRTERRVVTHMLAMTAVENRAPMILIVKFKAGDDALHLECAV